MRFFSFFAASLFSMYCLGQQVENLEVLSRRIEKSTAEKNHRINDYLKNRRQAFSFTSIEGDQYLLVDIDAGGNPIYRSTLNANAAITTGAAKLQSGVIGLMLEGKNLTLGIWDGGKIQTHIELGDRVISNEGEVASDHATHVTGTLIASGVNPAAKGMAPKAKIIAKY